MSGWYASRPARLDRRTYFVVEGTDPWNRYALDTGPLGEHARWWLKLQQKHQRWPWWRLRPPRITEARIITVGPYDRAIAWLVAAYAIWRCCGASWRLDRR